MSLSLPWSHLISSPARGETCAWCRCWDETPLAPSCCCFFASGWFLTNVRGTHNQHLAGAAVGKRKLTRNINSQILECPSVAALLALGRSLQTAGKPWPSCVVCKGELWGISHKSARQKMNESDSLGYGKEMKFAFLHIRVGCIPCT